MATLERRVSELEKHRAAQAAALVQRVGIYDPAEGLPEDDDGPDRVWLPDNGRGDRGAS